MNIPINGRIAIIDDKFEQAQPLMNVLARKKCPYLYYSGDVRHLPEPEQASNDIRILFLDINLLDDATHNAQQLRGTLIGVLKRVISASNFPWILIYWSRHEEEYTSLIEDIFNNTLDDRKPIAKLSQNKSDFFSFSGNKTPEFDTRVDNLFGEITKRLMEQPAYQQLVDWENLLHKAADKTLQDIFSAYHEHTNWSDNANYLMERLGESFAGKNFKDQGQRDKIKSAFQTLNNVFFDTLEYSVTNTPGLATPVLTYDPASAAKQSVYKINKKLLLSDDRENTEYSGMVIQDTTISGDVEFKAILNSCFVRKKVEENMQTQDKKQIDKECSRVREQIRESWIRIHLVVTPLCDVVQKKSVNIKIVKGFLISAEFKKYIDDKSEAIFMSPKFQLGDKVYVLVLNYRYFFTTDKEFYTHQQSFNFLLRIRQPLLAEIQSKLARHISRQGVLFIDDV